MVDKIDKITWFCLVIILIGVCPFVASSLISYPLETEKAHELCQFLGFEKWQRIKSEDYCVSYTNGTIITQSILIIREEGVSNFLKILTLQPRELKIYIREEAKGK